MLKKLFGSARRPQGVGAGLTAPDDDWTIEFDAFLARQFGKERRPKEREDLLRQEFKCFVATIVEPVFDDVWRRLGASDRSVQLEGTLDPEGGSATQYVVMIFSAGGRKEFWYRIQYQSDTDHLSITCTGVKGSGPQIHLENQFCPQICRETDQAPYEPGFRQITQAELADGVAAAYTEFKRKTLRRPSAAADR